MDFREQVSKYGNRMDQLELLEHGSIDLGIETLVDQELSLHNNILNKWKGLGARLTLRELRGRINTFRNKGVDIDCPVEESTKTYREVLEKGKNLIEY